MSVLAIVKFQGDTDKFRDALANRASEMLRFSDMARAAGGIHHRFGIGDGFVLVVDEWETPEHFQKFFAQPELQAFIATIGATQGPPEITVAEAVVSTDQY